MLQVYINPQLHFFGNLLERRVTAQPGNRIFRQELVKSKKFQIKIEKKASAPVLSSKESVNIKAP